MVKPKLAGKTRIVCLGGGTQVPPLLLEQFKRYDFQIVGVTSMVDSGGSGGYFRSAYGVLPPSDIRRHILALSNAPKWKKDLWKFRYGKEVFEDGHRGQVFANAFMAGLEITLKDYRKVLAFLADFMKTGGNQAYPATIKQTHIIAELENGGIVRGEAEIDVPRNHDSNLKIKRVYLDPAVDAFPEARKAVLNADIITIGPGDLYSSIIPCFLPRGIQGALKETKAKKILICNTLAKAGETQNFSILEFAGEIEKYMRTTLDYILYHDQPIPKIHLAKLQKKYPQISGFLAVNDHLPKDKFIGADLLKNNELAYDPKKIIRQIFKLINYK